MIFLETDTLISGITLDEFPHVRYCLPINFWPDNEERVINNVRAIVAANPQDDIALTFDSHLFERHFAQSIPRNTEAPYLSVEECADNYERAISGLGVNLHTDCLRQLRIVKNGLKNKDIRWLYCRPECGLWYQGSNKDEAARWGEVRAILIARGVGHLHWGYPEWHRLTHQAFNGFLRQVLHYLEWLEPLGHELNYWFANAHGDELGVHIDDWGNKVPPVNLEPEQWPNLYVYPPEKSDTQLARAVNFARHARNAVVHLRICAWEDEQGNPVDKIGLEDVVNRGVAINRAGGHIMLFTGDPKKPQYGSWEPPDGTVGAAVRTFCRSIT